VRPPERAQSNLCTDDLIRDLVSEEYAVIVLSSSVGREYSLESPEIKAGYFTRALTEGLSGRGDMNADGTIYLNELDRYVVDRVRDMTKAKQNPVTAKPSTLRWFPMTKY
jgi:hypothetical protein